MASIFPSSRANLPHYWGNILLSNIQDTCILWVFSSLWQVRRTISIPLWALGLLHPLLFGVSFLGLRYILHTYELVRMEQGTPREPCAHIGSSHSCSLSAVLPLGAALLSLVLCSRNSSSFGLPECCALFPQIWENAALRLSSFFLH